MDMMEIRNRCISTKYKALVTLEKGKGLNGTTGAEMVRDGTSRSGFYPVSFANGTKYDLTGFSSQLNSGIYGYNANKQFIHRTYAEKRSSITNFDQSLFVAGTEQGTGDIRYIRVVQSVEAGSSASIDLVDNLRIILEER